MSVKRTWMSITDAAELLGTTPAALRRSLERRATRAPDGGTEADLDGVVGRKFLRNWRVSLSPRWLAPIADNDTKPRAV